jgi:hypothetical protein
MSEQRLTALICQSAVIGTQLCRSSGNISSIDVIPRQHRLLTVKYVPYEVENSCRKKGIQA